MNGDTQLSLTADAAKGPAARETPPALMIVAYGTPAGQAALSTNQHGATYYSNANTLKPWRNAVALAAVHTAGTHVFAFKKTKKQKQPKAATPCLICGVLRGRHGLFHGAVDIDIYISLPPLKSGAAMPITRSSGDWDHLGRAVGDALVTASIVVDDSQITDGHVHKRYAGTGPMTLDRPGAVIRIWQVTPS
jgi:hypothetical protein